MTNKFSVVIVCKNEAAGLGPVLASVQSLTDDIVLYDNGSTDGTPEIGKKFGARVIEGAWLGYGTTKQQAVKLAKYDWVLSIDADEAVDDELRQALEKCNLSDDNTVYKIAFKNFLGRKHLKWGEWGGDRHIRLFNRKKVNWNDAAVHESLQFPPNLRIVSLKGYILHYTMKDIEEYSHKMVNYALLNAQKYFEQHKRSSWIKRNFSPAFTFIKHYVFQLGFLDGWEGLVAARMTFFYTFLKYARLKELNEQNK